MSLKRKALEKSSSLNKENFDSQFDDDDNEGKKSKSISSISNLFSTRSFSAVEGLKYLLTEVAPLMTKDWQDANNIGIKDIPAGLTKHLNDTLWILHYKIIKKGSFLLGAKVFQRDCRSEGDPYTEMAIVAIEIKGNRFENRWTNWKPCEATDRLIPGLYIHLFREYIIPYQQGLKYAMIPRILKSKEEIDDNDIDDQLNEYTHLLGSEEDVHVDPSVNDTMTIEAFVKTIKRYK